jgi:hypothetical protein
MVLLQQQVDNNAWHPVAFLSKALNPVERNYEIYDTEMLAIIRGLEKWRHYLEGVRGHPSVSLLPLSCPTLHLFICIPPPHLCTIFKDHT